MTDVSEITQSSFQVSKIKLNKKIWTTLIQGDLDRDGKVFNSITKAFKENYSDINAGYLHYNKENLAHGTHIRLVILAAMMTHGDILELGTGDVSTRLLHDILEQEENNMDRMLVSADSDQKKLGKFKDLDCSFHQLLLVPNCKGKNPMF